MLLRPALVESTYRVHVRSEWPMAIVGLLSFSCTTQWTRLTRPSAHVHTACRIDLFVHKRNHTKIITVLFINSNNDVIPPLPEETSVVQARASYAQMECMYEGQ